MAMNPIMVQAISYVIVLGLAIFIISVLLRGFFFKFLRVRASMGKLLMVKVKAIHRSYFKTGEIEEGFLCYKKGKDRNKIAITDPTAIYRLLGVQWVDVDEEKNCIIKPDSTSIPGFDAEKFNSLYLRALYKPQITTGKEMIVILLIILAIIVAGASLYYGYKNSVAITNLATSIKTISATTIKGGGL